MAKDLEQVTLPIPNFVSPPSSDLTVSSLDLDEATIPLSHYLWIVRRRWPKIAIFVLSSLALTYVLSSRFEPIYESTAVVNIDRAAPVGVVGTDSQRTATVAQDVDPYIATQMKIIQSDAVLRPITDRFKLLDLEGQLKNLTTEKVVGLRNSPIILRRLRVTRPPNTYLVQIAYRSTDPRLAADVANAIARSYLEHIYRIQIDSSTSAAGFMERQLDELKAKMERSSQALALFEKELNLVNPEEKTNIISARLLQLNAEYTNAQADRVKKEAIYRALDSESLAATQISGQAEELQKLQDRINEAQERFAEVSAGKGPSHPEFKKAELQLTQLRTEYASARENASERIKADYNQSVNREHMLSAAVAATKAEFDAINSRSFGYQRLKEEADADKRLYQELVTKIREASINAGFENKNTAVADYARPALKPVFPNTKLNLLLAGLLSLLLGVGTVILIDSLDTTVRDPEQIRRLFHTDLIGTLPMIRDTKLLTPNLGVAKMLPAAGDDSAQRSFTSFEEAVRMVRNSILLSDGDRNLRSILFTSATPGEGKSTTALHLAIAHANQGRKTLLIDADLRRPTLHKKLGVNSFSGLSAVLTGESSWEDAVCCIQDIINLSILPAGPPSRRAADLIGSRISQILDESSRYYDLVIVDGPPMLGFAEPMQLAIAVDGVVMVAVAGETNRKAIGACLTLLERLRVNVVGLVLNRTSKESGSGYYYYYQYEKYYRAA